MEDTTRTILQFYREDICAAIALVQIETGSFPISILNELRSVLTHLARADFIDQNQNDLPAEDIELTRREQLRKARHHLERVRLDCSKVNLLHSAEAIDRRLEKFAALGPLAKSIWDEASNLTGKRKSLAHRENSETPEGDLVVQYQTLVAEFLRFEKTLEVEYGGRYLEIVEAERRLQTTRTNRNRTIDVGLSFLLGIGASYLASMIWAHFHP